MSETEEKLEKFIESSDNIPQVSEHLSEEDISVIKNTVAQDLSKPELNLFLKVCASTSLNPFTGEIWCFKDGKGKPVMFAGRDGFLKAAQKHEQFAGIQSSVVRQNDHISIDMGSASVDHQIDPTQDRGPVIGAWAKVFRKDGNNNVEYAPLSEYDRGNHAWKKNQEAMIRKVPEKLVCKKAFGLPVHIQEDFAIDDQGTAHVVDKSQEESQEKKELRERIEMLGAEKVREHLENGDIPSEIIEKYPDLKEMIYG